MLSKPNPTCLSWSRQGGTYADRVSYAAPGPCLASLHRTEVSSIGTETGNCSGADLMAAPRAAFAGPGDLVLQPQIVI